MPEGSINIKPNGLLHRRICEAVQDRIEFSKQKFAARHQKWREDEEKTLAFLPERDIDKQRRNLRESGKPQYTTIVLPYSYGVLMAAHTYWSTVFLSRTPILQYSGRHGESSQQLQALEALMDYQVQVGEMMVPLNLWLLDTGKYGVGWVGNYWDEQFARVTKIVEEEDLFLGRFQRPGGPKKRKTKVTETIRGYTGNKIYNIRPYDSFPDPRVPVSRFQEGEFWGIYRELGWNEIVRRGRAGSYVNIDRLKPGDQGGANQRIEGSSELELPETDNTFSFSSFDKKAGDTTKVYETYIELIPAEWEIGKADLPEKWVFTVTSDYELVIGAQPLGMYHDKFPGACMEYEPEAYALANRSIQEVLDPVQRTMDWLVNMHFYNVRKAVNDQFIVDPSKVVMKDFENPTPGGAIRLKPTAYGSGVQGAVEQLKVNDITRQNLADMQAMVQAGERAVGVNDQILATFGAAGSSRKTATEIRTSSTFGVNRLKTSAEYMSQMGLAPLSQMMVQNSQQFYDDELKFRIVGDLALHTGPQFMDVTPDMIQGFYDFVPVDGTLPVDRFAQANLWREMLQSAVRFPQVLAQYDMGKLFAFIAQLAGLKNINQFRIDFQSPEAIQQQVAAGNIVPIDAGNQPPGTQRNLERIPSRPVGQVGNAG